MENPSKKKKKEERNQDTKIYNQICVESKKQDRIFDKNMTKYMLTFLETILEDLYQKFIDSKLQEDIYLLLSILFIELINGLFSFVFLLKFDAHKTFLDKFILIIGVKIFAIVLHILEFFQSDINCFPKWIWTIFSFLGIAVGDCFLFFNQSKLGDNYNYLSNLLTFGIGIQYFCCINLHIRNFSHCLLIFVLTFIIMVLISFARIIIEFTFQTIIIFGFFLYLIVILFFMYKTHKHIRLGFYSLFSLALKMIEIKKLIKILPVPLVVTKEQSLVSANKSCMQMFNSGDLKNLEEKCKNTIVKSYDSEESKTIFEIATKKEGLGNSKNYTFFKNHIKGQVEISKLLIHLNQDECILTILKDISSIYKDSKNHLQKRFEILIIGSLTHHVRTPLNCIAGSCDIGLNISDLPKSISDIFQRIKNQSIILEESIDNIQEYFDIINSTSSIICTTFNPEEEIKKILNMFYEELSEKGLEFRLNTFCTSASIPFANDLKKFRQIVVSLISNSIKYTQHGIISITINYIEEDKKYFFSVKDTGIGITPEKLVNLFTFFSKIEDEELDAINLHGISIGLSLSKAFCEAMGGVLTLKSDLDLGTEVNFNIQNKFIDKNESVSNPNLIWISRDDNLTKRKFSVGKKESKSVDLVKSPKILIVDDTESNLLVLKSYSNKVQVEYDIARNGLEALNLVKNLCNQHLQYQYILMDINMPIMDGIIATKEIRNIGNCFSKNSLPIIGVTANTERSIISKCIQAGMNEIKHKPLPFEDFKEINLIYSNWSFDEIDISNSN